MTLRALPDDLRAAAARLGASADGLRLPDEILFGTPYFEPAYLFGAYPSAGFAQYVTYACSALNDVGNQVAQLATNTRLVLNAAAERFAEIDRDGASDAQRAMTEIQRQADAAVPRDL